MPGQKRGAFRRTDNDVRKPGNRGLLGGLQLDQFGVRHNDAQNVIEVVSHARRKRAHRLHLLRPDHLFHQSCSLRNVLDDTGVAVARGATTDEHGQALSLARHEVCFEILYGRL